MIFFPAIDLKEGRVVRLKQGDYDQVTQYSEDPVQVAQDWARQGAQWLHLVDLDAAKAGRPVNHELILKICEVQGLKVQVGGGIRDIKMARSYLEGGVARVVVGTQAIQEPSFLKALGETFPDRVALGLDTKKGHLALKGWTETTALSAEEYLKTAPLKGIACLIFTDIARDGTLQGPNLEALRDILAQSPLPVIASGGISGLKDLRELTRVQDPKLMGVISGKALYEGKFTLREALEIFN